MVSPVTPHNTSINLKTMELGPNGWFERVNVHISRRGFRQPPPYTVDTPLLYRRHYSTGSSFVSMNGVLNRAAMQDVEQEALNKARAKFKSVIGDASQIGSTMTAELKATFGTVVGGTITAFAAARQVAKGNILEAGRLLNFSPPVVRKTVRRTAKRGKKFRKKFRVQNEYWQMPDGRMVLKSLGNKWLWYSYGVRPLIDDLYNASSVFTREIPGTKVLGKGYAERDEGPGPDRYRHKANARVTAYVKVKNPNLWLANQLGLINPVQWFNEGVAFSFVIDWFSNWSDWLQQLTDFVGLEIARPNTISMIRTEREWRFPGEWFPHWDAYYVKVRREQGIPPVVLRFAYERFQWQRGANAVSLLVQFLKDKK